MFNSQTLARADQIIAKLDESDGMFVQGMVNEIERLNKQLIKMAKVAAQASWVSNPDRSGGQFTDEEISRSRDGGW